MGKFTDEDLNEEDNVFAAQYYGDEGLYLNDFAENFGNQMYVSSESEFNYPKFSKMLDNRYKSEQLVLQGRLMTFDERTKIIEKEEGRAYNPKLA